ncbi:hypothetical protein [Sinorhizobium psoraleae]|uniref:hypothetical protein n=1 Tax=Sinorhizobium psoraleae TaxID=520838 RepID=UPI001FE84BF2|nr:hypothetical protein [Sinorhizobium psoraleae]
MPSDAPRDHDQQGAGLQAWRSMPEPIARTNATEFSERSPVAITPPGGNPLIIPGYGTVAADPLEWAGNFAIDTIMVPCGGGGLSAGTCMGARASNWKSGPSNRRF